MASDALLSFAGDALGRFPLGIVFMYFFKSHWPFLTTSGHQYKNQIKSN